MNDSLKARGTPPRTNFKPSTQKLLLQYVVVNNPGALAPGADVYYLFFMNEEAVVTIFAQQQTCGARDKILHRSVTSFLIQNI
jgi:hypothetical protein